MSEATLRELHDSPAGIAASMPSAPQQTCDECVGSGGWYRYEPALEPAPGLLYLSCVQCRGSGRADAHRG